ncbi:MAG: response regulator transcription factor [Opitutaceae bacterium]
MVEDDASIAKHLTEGLREAGFSVSRVSSGAEARMYWKDSSPSLIILDLGLPDVSGMDLLQELRKDYPDLPVIITTARDQIADRVRGLEKGADDYLVKPYSFEELLARIRTQLRRSGRALLNRAVGDLELNLQNRSATSNGKALDLTPREFDLLALLVSVNGNVVTREMIQRDVFNVKSRMTSMDNVIDVHLSRLRKKLDECGSSFVIQTIRGVGIALRREA